MAKRKNNKKYEITELIMVTPFGDFSRSTVGSMKKINSSEGNHKYYGRIDIEGNKICCACRNKEDIEKCLEGLFYLTITNNKNHSKAFYNHDLLEIGQN